MDTINSVHDLENLEIINHNLIRTRTTSIELNRESVNDTVIVNMTNKIPYDLLPFVINEHKNFYKIKHYHQYYIDGVQFDDEALFKTLEDPCNFSLLRKLHNIFTIFNT